MIASSTISRFAAFLRSRIAVLKSLFGPLLEEIKKTKTKLSENGKQATIEQSEGKIFIGKNSKWKRVKKN